ncbi:hypothetical protein AWC38_SpisGene25443, partial [Stylophora pistillata]
MIPRRYEPTDEHALMGAIFLSAAGEGTLEILEKMLGIPHVYANTHGLQPGGMQQALTLYGGTAMAMGSEALKTLMKAHPYMAAVTTGLALDTMLNNGELTKGMTRLMQTATEEVWKAAKTAMDIASWVTKDQGFDGFDQGRMQKFITWVADEDKSKILATYGVERGVQILSTPEIDAEDIKRLIHMNITKGYIEFAEIAKIPGGIRPSEKGEEEGVRWFDEKGDKYIRIMNGKGDDAKHGCQREDYVKIVRRGQLRDKDGKAVKDGEDGMRYELIKSMEGLSDFVMQKEKWVDPKFKHSFSDEMDYPIDMLLDQGNLHEKSYSTAKIGYWFRDAKEASVSHDVAKALKRIIKEIGIDKPDSAYINSPLWQAVVKKAKIAYDMLMEDEDLDELRRQEKDRVFALSVISSQVGAVGAFDGLYFGAGYSGTTSDHKMGIAADSEK